MRRVLPVVPVLRVPLVLVSGCLLVMPPPELPCEPERCATGYNCLDRDECVSRCESDADCWDGYVCVYGDCDPECRDEDCKAGLVCDYDKTDCLTYCETNDECKDGWTCCTWNRWVDDKCENLDGCFR